MSSGNLQLEKTLAKEQGERRTLTLRYTILLFLAFFIITIPMDFRILPEKTGAALLIRLCITGPILLLLFLFSFNKNFHRNTNLFVSIMILSAGAGVNGMLTLAEPGSAGFFFWIMVLIITVMISYLMPRYSFYPAVICSGSLTASYIAIMIIKYDAITSTDFFQLFWVTTGILFIANIAGALLKEAQNRFYHMDFLFQKNLTEAYDTLQYTYDRIQEDLNIARKIQKNIMPSGPVSPAGLKTRVYYHPFRSISGDFYDITEVRPGYSRFFVADATGHGIQAALITMIIKSEYETLKREDIDAATLLSRLNSNFIRSYSSLETYFSCFIMDIDTENKRLRYSSAGHPEQFLVTSSGIEPLMTGGVIIGDMPDTSYTLMERELESGDKILLFTDGLYERKNEDTEKELKSRILETIQSHRAEEVETFFASLLVTLDIFNSETGVETSNNDDITVIAVEVI